MPEVRKTAKRLRKAAVALGDPDAPATTASAVYGFTASTISRRELADAARAVRRNAKVALATVEGRAGSLIVGMAEVEW